MDGLHKLKTPGLFASLFFQVTSIYLLFQATGLRSTTLADESLSRRIREGQVSTESVSRLQEVQCSEGIAGYQWGAMGTLLLSIGCLSPLIMLRRPEEKETKQEEKKTILPREPEIPYRPEPEVSESVVATTGMYKNLKKGLDELENCLKNQPVTIVGDGMLVKTVHENVRLLENRNRATYESLIAGHDEIQKAATRLQRLMEQCRESANYSATNRVDWKKNKLIDILSQMRQNLDIVVDLSKNINSVHASTLRLLGESLHGENILNDKITRAQEHLEKIQNSAHGGNKIHDTIISIIGESRDNITGASKFVGSLNQKWDSLVHMTEQIDEVAEKINAQSLAASLELVRGQTNSQGVTDLFPLGTELRGLAAKFHTYARHIKDAIHDVRDEVNKTATYLSQAGAKADQAFVSVNQCGEYYRSSVAAVKHSASELVLLQQEVNIHMKKLQETRVMGMTSADLLGQMDRNLQGQNGFGIKIMEETSQITVHSEKISTLLAKQYHELNHCQKILASSAPMLSDTIRFTTETKQTISTLAACLERVQTSDDVRDHGPRTDEVLVAKIEDFKQLIASMKDNAEPSQPGTAMRPQTPQPQGYPAPQRTLAVQQQQRTPATWRVMN
jgi:methyl-accepting chemotaxis protein